MLKRVFLSIAIVVVIAYLATAVTILNAKAKEQVCRNIELVIKDTVYAKFIDKAEIGTILQKKELYPIGKLINQVETKALEVELNKHPLIDNAECYWTPSGRLQVEVSQRVPILRIMCNKNGDYYLDNKGSIMPSDAKCIAHRAIVTGNVEKAFVMNELYNFGVFLQKNPFWNAQIEQIHVLADRNIELIPRVGDHVIFLGKIDGYEQKLDRLKTFYQKALNQVGWNKYSRISLEFGNQIVCTKRGEK